MRAISNAECCFALFSTHNARDTELLMFINRHSYKSVFGSRLGQMMLVLLLKSRSLENKSMNKRPLEKTNNNLLLFELARDSFDTI